MGEANSSSIVEKPTPAAGFRERELLGHNDQAVDGGGEQKQSHQDFPSDRTDRGFRTAEAVGQDPAQDQSSGPAGMQNIEIVRFLPGIQRRNERIDGRFA